MRSSASIRNQIEDALLHRIPSALTPVNRSERAVAATGISAVDELLEGGLPLGAITELTGSECTGRATLAIAFAAQRIQAGNVCAWVDVSDSFDPESAEASGVELSRLLWVRCGSAAPMPTMENVQFSIQHQAAQDSQIHVGGGSPHPRSEERDMSKAVEAMLQGGPSHYRRDKTVGTPGVSNRPWYTNKTVDEGSKRAEQVPYDRLPPRRGDYVLRRGQSAEERKKDEPRYTESQDREAKTATVFEKRVPLALPNIPAASRSRGPRAESKPWSRLDQALRVTDLLLQAGGFGAIVLDMGNIAPSAVTRIPLATLFRFRAAADRSRSSLLLLTQHPCAQSSAEVLLRMTAALPDSGSVMTAIPFGLEIVRQRFKPQTNVVSMRKPPQRATQTKWQAPTAWAVVG